MIWRSLWGDLLCTTDPPSTTIACTATGLVSDGACMSYSSVDKPILTMIGWLKANVASQASSSSDGSSTSVLPRSWCRTNSHKILATKYTVKLSTTRNYRSFGDRRGERSVELIWVRGVTDGLGGDGSNGGGLDGLGHSWVALGGLGSGIAGV